MVANVNQNPTWCGATWLPLSTVDMVKSDMVNCAMQHFFTLSTFYHVKSDNGNGNSEKLPVSTELHEMPSDFVQMHLVFVEVNFFKQPFFKKKAFFETPKN